MNKNSNFRNIRKELRLTQQEFADKLETSQNQISKYEKGQIDLPYNIIFNLNKVFNVNINWLLTSKGSMFVDDTSSININNKNGNGNTSLAINGNGNVALNGGAITINKSDYVDADEIKELLEILKDVPKSWVKNITDKLRNSLNAINYE